MKNNQYSMCGSFLRNVNCALIMLLVFVSVIGFKPIFGRPRSTHDKSSLEIFSREARNLNLKSEKAEKSSKSFRMPYLRLRTIPSTELVAKETSNHVLECEAGGSPMPTIHWLKNGKRILQNEAEEVNEDEDNVKKGILSLSFTRSRLYLDCIHPKDEAVYSCIASTPFNRVSTDTHLKVVPNLSTDNESSNNGENSVSLCLTRKSYGYPSRIYMWTHNRLEMIGSEVQLFCRANGSPQPSISWLGPEENQIVNNEKHHILENGDLIIRDLSWDDMGNYYCIAENQHGSDRISIFLYPTLPE